MKAADAWPRSCARMADQLKRCSLSSWFGSECFSSGVSCAGGSKATSFLLCGAGEARCQQHNIFASGEVFVTPSASSSGGQAINVVGEITRDDVC
jgi:hypothetical protein